MIVTRGYGITVDDINWGCPTDFEPYIKAYKQQEKKKDEEMWMQGLYVYNAFQTVMENFGDGLSGKRGNSKYIKKPFMQSEKADGKLTEGELQKQREAFVMGLKVMQSNYELNHKKSEDSTVS